MSRRINTREATPKMEFDNQISLRYYYRIADNLLQEANIHREMKHALDLYIVLLRFSSLISETIPCHKDYINSNKPEKDYYKKKLLLSLNELEALKPEVELKLAEQNRPSAPRKPSNNSSRPTLMSKRDDDNKKTQETTKISLSTPLVEPRQQTCSSRNNNLKRENRVGSGSSSSKEDEVKNNGCVVCFDGAIEGACVPCGHMAGCMACLNGIKASTNRCPICRVPIQMVLRLYAV